MPRVLEGITKEAVSKVIAYFKYLDETYPAFTKTLGEFLEGIKINWWDDVITNGAKSINDISLSDGGKYIKKYPGNPSSTSSEIISFENFYRRGARFLKGENGPSAIRYVDNGVGGKPVDFLGEMNGKKVAVSVTRVFRSIDNAKEPVLTKALAKRDIQGAIDALSNRLPTAIDKWDEGVVHVFVKQSDKSLVESAITEVNLGQNKIVVTVVEDNSFIWS
ncbi:MAG: hypothetical protein QXO27_04215 [Candidatus Aenigmatarchaeota archaeon]